MKLHRIAGSFGAGALILVTGLLTTNSFAGATSAQDQSPSAHALFVETDNGGANSVISYTRANEVFSVGFGRHCAGSRAPRVTSSGPMPVAAA